TWSLYRRRTLRALPFITVLPSDTWPSPPITTLPWRRTETIVVTRSSCWLFKIGAARCTRCLCHYLGAGQGEFKTWIGPGVTGRDRQRGCCRYGVQRVTVRCWRSRLLKPLPLKVCSAWASRPGSAKGPTCTRCQTSPLASLASSRRASRPIRMICARTRSASLRWRKEPAWRKYWVVGAAAACSGLLVGGCAGGGGGGGGSGRRPGDTTSDSGSRV